MKVHRLHKVERPGEQAAAVRKGYPPAQARVKERERQAGQKNKIRVIRLQQNSKTNNQAAKGIWGDIRKTTNFEFLSVKILTGLTAFVLGSSKSKRARSLPQTINFVFSPAYICLSSITTQDTDFLLYSGKNDQTAGDRILGKFRFKGKGYYSNLFLVTIQYCTG